jgi:hypothetical protein
MAGADRRAVRQIKEALKTRWAISLSRHRPIYPFFRRSGSGPDHNVCHPEIIRDSQARARVSVILPMFHQLQEFPFTIHPRLPGASLVADSRGRLWFPLSFWKIALPLKRTLRRRHRNCQGVWLILGCANRGKTVEIPDMLSYVVIPPTNRRDSEEIGPFNVRQLLHPRFPE